MSLAIGARRLRATSAFETYFRFAVERQQIFFRRLRGTSPPWTEDIVLRTYRFTNPYRAIDRTSQFLIGQILAVPTDGLSAILRVILFKVFNSIDTWKFLEQHVGPICIDSFDAVRITQLLDARSRSGQTIYSGAYVIPCPRLDQPTKHANHLQLVARLLADGTIERLLSSAKLEDLYRTIVNVPSFGPFLAYQLAIDLNYSTLFSFSEMDFIVAGPGARSGIRKCFRDLKGVSPESIIESVAENATELFEARNLQFPKVENRPLQLVDCQNLFCELDKYSRVVHPQLARSGDRHRMKRKFRPSEEPVTLTIPPSGVL